MATPLKASWIACIALLKLTHAHAAAFSMDGSSPSALGNAFAGAVTGTRDNSDAFFNPATLRSFKNTELNIGTTNVRSTIDATSNSSMFSDNIRRTGRGAGDRVYEISSATGNLVAASIPVGIVKAF